MELHKVNVDGKQLKIQQFGAKQGWKLLRKLSEIAGPAIAYGSDNKWAELFKDLFEKLDDEQMFSLLDELTSVVLVDDAKYSEKHLKQYYFTIQVCGEVIKYNFEDFFLPIQKMLADLAIEEE